MNNRLPENLSQIGFLIQKDSNLTLMVKELSFIDSGIITSHSWDGFKALVQSKTLSQLFVEYSAITNPLGICKKVRTVSDHTGIVLLCDYQHLNDVFKDGNPDIDDILLKPVGVRQILFAIQKIKQNMEARSQANHMAEELQFARTRMEELVKLIDQKYPGGLEALSSSSGSTSAGPSREGVERRYTRLQSDLPNGEGRNRT
ncbi:MAG: hypothetical protein GXO90_04360 [FCB group bacterium]|nr:hypothetical protein [FCB group bacterium]